MLVNPQSLKLKKAFDDAGFSIRFVGGCVRDFYLGQDPKDIDFCTDATPDEMESIATANDFKFLPTGIKHGTATLIVDGDHFEITTLRIDVETDGRHAEVEFTRDFEADAARRDLTFNAMSMDFDGVIYDYFGGRKHLENKVVKFVGNSADRIEEDYLRILRFYRFAARFDCKIELEDQKAILERSEKLKLISMERIWQEMSKILDPKICSLRIVNNMRSTGVLKAIGLNRIPGTLEFLNTKDSVSTLSALIVADELEAVLERWKFSSQEKAKIQYLVNTRYVYWSERKIRKELVMHNVPRDFVVSALQKEGFTYLIEYAKTYEVPVFPLSGKDLLKLGFEPGVKMGEILQKKKLTWADSDFTMTKEELMKDLVNA